MCEFSYGVAEVCVGWMHGRTSMSLFVWQSRGGFNCVGGEVRLFMQLSAKLSGQ